MLNTKKKNLLKDKKKIVKETMDDEEAVLREQIFHNNVREQIVSKIIL